MSLLEEQMDNCIMKDKRSIPDGYGGTKSTWVDGAPFRAAIVLDTSMEARSAEQQGVTNVYTVVTTKSVNLQYHDVFLRESDGKIFRVKSDGDDKKTPSSAGLNMRVVTAEEWEIPDGQSTGNS